MQTDMEPNTAILHFPSSVLRFNKWVQSTGTLPHSRSIYLFICLHSFFLLWAEVGGVITDVEQQEKKPI